MKQYNGSILLQREVLNLNYMLLKLGKNILVLIL